MVGGYIIIDMAKPAKELVAKLSMNNHNKAVMIKMLSLAKQQILLSVHIRELVVHGKLQFRMSSAIKYLLVHTL